MPPGSSKESVPAVELFDISKSFGRREANIGVNLRVLPGSLHGIIGENGAGKSTAMKILFGMIPPDRGEIRIDGVTRKWASPRDAIAAGLGMVHQHFMLAGPMTALDNILLGDEPHDRFGSIRRKEAKVELEALAERYHLPVPWDAKVETLPVGIQQRIEILKLLYRHARILILDEPTAVLTPEETRELFTNLRKLKAEGKAILIITHKLQEVLDLTDRVTVFRAGHVTGDLETSQTDSQDLADRMVGRKVLLRVEVLPQPPAGDPFLEVSGLRWKSAGASERLKGVGLTIRGGEIVGIAGVEGNGQDELLEVLLHPREHFSGHKARAHGEYRLFGENARNLGCATLRARGVSFVPADRHRDGLALDRPLEENFALGLHRSRAFSRRGVLWRNRLSETCRGARQAFDVRASEEGGSARSLSGGNQQKLILAREFERSPRLFIAAQPTRGVDVGAIEFIHRRILEARTAGAGVLLISSELEEILALSDRVLVLYEGSIRSEFARGKCDEKILGLYMGGGGGGRELS